MQTDSTTKTETAAASLIAILNAMGQYGGSFVKALARATIERDSGHHFALALIEMRSRADDYNIAKLEMSIPDIWGVYDMSEDERLGHLQDAWPDEFAKYAEMATLAAARAVA